MKYVKTLAIWVVISLVAQTTLLLFLNNYYLGDEKKIVYKDMIVKKQEKLTEKYYTLPKEAEKFSASYDGKYFSYYVGNIINVVNAENFERKEINLEAQSNKSISKWLDDRNRLVIAETQKVNNVNKIKFFSYDAKDASKVETKDFINNKEVSIKLENEVSEIKDIVFNTMNTVFYPKVNQSINHGYVYRIDVAQPIETLKLQSVNIGEIQIIKNEDKIVYEDADTKKVYIGKNKKPLGIEAKDGVSLLKVDAEGEIYVGSMTNGLVENIYHGKSTEAENSWKQLKLKEPASIEEIYITSTGGIYVNNKNKMSIFDVLNSVNFPYEGVLLKNYDNGIFYLKNNSMVIKKEFSLN